MIRGIPKEGWKRGVGVTVGPGVTGVMIRGIPKEGWKHRLSARRGGLFPPR
jgi:hypothetical protein